MTDLPWCSICQAEIEEPWLCEKCGREVCDQCIEEVGHPGSTHEWCMACQRSAIAADEGRVADIILSDRSFR